MSARRKRPARGIARRLAVVAPAVVLAACTVGPDYVRPPDEAPATFREAPAMASAAAAAPRFAVADGRWWRVYGDDVLDALQAEVDVGNATLRVYEARVRQARALVDASRATYYPSLGIDGANEKIGLSAQWEIDLWGRIRRTVEASRAAAQASADDLAAARLSVQAQLAQTYFLLRVQDDEIRLLQSRAEAFERSLQLTRNQYAVGVAARGDVVQAEAQLYATQAQAIEAGAARAQYEHALAVLVGKAPADFAVAPRPIRADVPAIPAGVPSELLRRRPDIAAAERRVAAASAQIGVAESAYYPSLVLFAGGGVERTLRGGAGYGFPLFDGGLRDAQTARAEAVHDEALAAYRQTVLASFAEVEDNLAALRILGEQANKQDAAVRASTESVRITNNQYRAGIATYLAVVVVQAAALNNERGALAILGRRLVASVNLIKALGGGWEAAPPPPPEEGQTAEILGRRPDER